MPVSEIVHRVYLADTPQFDRLVEFVAEVEEHAEGTEDWMLMDLVGELRAELMALYGLE